MLNCEMCHMLIKTATGITYTAQEGDDGRGDGRVVDTCVEKVIAAITNCGIKGTRCQNKDVKAGLDALLGPEFPKKG